MSRFKGERSAGVHLNISFYHKVHPDFHKGRKELKSYSPFPGIYLGFLCVILFVFSAAKF